MPQVEVFEGVEATEPLFVAAFDFLPRVGDYLSKEMGGYFRYLNVVEVWHREDNTTESYQSCVRIEARD